MRSKSRRHLLVALSLAATAIAAAAAPPSESPWPTKPITIVVPFAPGGPADAIVRTIAEQLAPRLGQPVIVDFKGGASGILGTDAVAKAVPDGHTLLAATSDMLVNNTATFSQLPFDPLRDLTLVTQVGTMPLVLAVHGAVPGRYLADVAQAVRAPRGAFSFGSWGHGINAHLAGEWLFNRKFGADAVHAPYRGLAPLTQDLVGQRLGAAFGVVPAFAPFVPGGKLKVVAVTGPRRVAAFPDVPTFAEQGHHDEIFQLGLWMALAAPSGTPAAVIERLHREMVPVVRGPQLLALLTNAGFEPLANTPAQARANLLRELQVIPRLVREIGLQPAVQTSVQEARP